MLPTRSWPINLLHTIGYFALFERLRTLYVPTMITSLHQFSAGLPNPFRETNWRREHGRMDGDLARFMLDDDESKLMVYILQGGCADSPRSVSPRQPTGRESSENVCALGVGRCVPILVSCEQRGKKCRLRFRMHPAYDLLAAHGCLAVYFSHPNRVLWGELRYRLRRESGLRLMYLSGV